MARLLLLLAAMQTLAALRQAVAIGLCLAMPAFASAHSGPSAHTPAQVEANVKALQAQMNDRVALQRYLDVPRDSLLHANLAELHAARGRWPQIASVTRGGVTLQLYDGYVRVQSGRRAKPDDLHNVGINSIADLDAAVQEQLRAQLLMNHSKPVVDRELTALKKSQRAESRQLQQLHQHPDLRALAAYQRNVVAKKDPAKISLALQSAGDDVITLHVTEDGAPDHLSIGAGGEERWLDVGHLAHLQLHTDGAWNDLVQRSLVAASGVGGDAANPAVVERARKMLKQQAAEMEVIEDWLLGKKAPPRVALLATLMNSHKHRWLTLAQNQTETLTLSHVPGSGHTMPWLTHRPLHAPNPVLSGIVDLARFDLANLTNLDAALGELLMSYSSTPSVPR